MEPWVDVAREVEVAHPYWIVTLRRPDGSHESRYFHGNASVRHGALLLTNGDFQDYHSPQAWWNLRRLGRKDSELLANRLKKMKRDNEEQIQGVLKLLDAR